MEDNYTFQLLAPRSGSSFGHSEVNNQSYAARLAEVQRLRGQVYLESEAVRPQELAPDGRFAMRGDQESWHLLLLDVRGAVVGCSRYYCHPAIPRFEQLRTLEIGNAGDGTRYEAVRRAVETDLQAATSAKLAYVEIGGWALNKSWQGTRAALETLLSGYALGALWGGSILLGLATVQQGASSVLRRIGGSGLKLNGEALPALPHSTHARPLELLRFDSRFPAPRFLPLIDRIVRKLSNSVIFQPEWANEDGLRIGFAFGASTA